MDPQLLQHLILANDKSHGSLLFIVKDDLVVLDVALVCATAVFGGAGRGEMPFDETCTGYQGNVVQVEYLEIQFKARLTGAWSIKGAF